MKSKFLATVVLVSSSWMAQSEMTLDSVLADYIEAKGGMEVIKSTKTMKTTGKMTMGAMEAPFEFTFKAPNKIHTTFELQGMKGIQAFDGEKGWQVMPFMGKTEPVVMSEDELKQIKDQADLEGPLVDHEAKGIKLELIGKTEIEGTPVVEVKATKPSGDVVHVFLDEEYMIEVMTRTKVSMMGQEVEAETYFSDYKEVGEAGSPVAHSMAVKMNGAVVQNLTLENIELNIDVADSLFAMPAVAEKETAEAAQ
jgi:outer membrane lipoprotein-sorting protein